MIWFNLLCFLSNLILKVLVKILFQSKRIIVSIHILLSKADWFSFEISVRTIIASKRKELNIWKSSQMCKIENLLLSEHVCIDCQLDQKEKVMNLSSIRAAIWFMHSSVNMFGCKRNESLWSRKKSKTKYLT
jgi:hypothetical protein